MAFGTNSTMTTTDPCEDYKVLCGIEEEFLLIDKNGTLINAADEVMVRAARILERDNKRLSNLQLKIRGLDAEPSPSQIEYVTLPLPPRDLEDALILGRKLLADAAGELELKILAQSMHPIQSDPNPMCGTHLNVSVQRQIMNVEELAAVHDYLWNHLPELIAVSANSPLFQGSYNNIASNRIGNSTVLKPNGFSQIQIPEHRAALTRQQYYGRMRYALQIGASENVKRVVTNPRGERLVDITPRGPFTNIAEDQDSSVMTNRVEVRIFDVQQDLSYLLNIAYLLCASSLQAIYLYKTSEITPDPFHKVNVEKATYDGMNAHFVRESSKEESAHDSLNRWITEIDRFLRILTVQIKNFPEKKGDLIQKDLEVNFTTRDIEQLRQQGKTYAVVEMNRSRTLTHRGRTYTLSRGTQLEGTLSADYQLSYKESNNIVSTFNGLSIVNTLDVQGISVPLESNDRILVALNRNQYLSRRFLGNFGF